jgi:hypothetical protein
MTRTVYATDDLYFVQLSHHGATERHQVKAPAIHWGLVSKSTLVQPEGLALGEIRWHGLSKQYAFYVAPGAVLPQNALAKIFRIVRQLNREWQKQQQAAELAKRRLLDPLTDRVQPGKENDDAQ